MKPHPFIIDLGFLTWFPHHIERLLDPFGRLLDSPNTAFPST